MSTSFPGAAIDLRTRRRNATRIDIQKAALALFEQHGFDETTVDEIARVAGISPRTFFRYFATKEDSVLGDMHGFDEALHRCIATAAATDDSLSTLSLADIEGSFRVAIGGFRHAQSEVAETSLRIRKLVCANPALSAAALRHCAENTRRWLSVIDERGYPVTARSRIRIRMILEIAQLTVQCAFDEWVNASVPATPEADLLTIYDAACARVRDL